jgi:transposase
MRPKGSATELEARRLLAGEMILQGKDNDEILEILGVSVTSVNRWRRAVEKGGLDALKSKPHPGRKPRLTTKQKRQLVEILLAGPRKAGYQNDFWTCRRIAEVVEQRFQVEYHPDYIGRMLHDLGWTCQMPEQRAREADDAAMKRWRTRDWPRIKRGPSPVAAL